MTDSTGTVLYEDDRITCTDSGLVIHGYYFPLATAKRIPYGEIRTVEQIELGSGRWRIWGGTDPRYWFNLDLHRPHKASALVLELGKAIRPVITPDDPVRVRSIVEQHLLDRRA
jgi:hypothetical protein